MAGPLRDEIIRLSDGRALAYAEWGDQHGPPAFFFTRGSGVRTKRKHGERGSVSSASTDRASAAQICSLAGASDWPADVVELADALDVERFAVAGFSGGGPYAIACVALIGDRVLRAISRQRSAGWSRSSRSRRRPRSTIRRARSSSSLPSPGRSSRATSRPRTLLRCSRPARCRSAEPTLRPRPSRR
jgi:pimeloyl-ACP methyl ester carboxylesterase